MMGFMRPSFRASLIALILSTGLLVAACGSSSSGNKADFCKRAGDLKNLGGSLGKSTSLAGIKSGFAKLNTKIEQADSAAPSDIKKDVDTIKKTVGSLNTEVQKAKSMQELSTLGPKFNSLTSNSDIKSAGDRVTTYAKKNCNIDLSS